MRSAVHKYAFDADTLLEMPSEWLGRAQSEIEISDTDADAPQSSERRCCNAGHTCVPWASLSRVDKRGERIRHLRLVSGDAIYQCEAHR